MKKIVTLILAISLCFLLISCDGDQNKSDTNNADNKLSEEQLKDVAYNVRQAEIFCDQLSLLLLQKWATGDNFVYYFEEDFPAEHYWAYDYYKLAREYRIAAKSSLENAKLLLENDGEGEIYNTAKKYYQKVNKYYNLVSEYPSGYSKLTYSNAISNIKSECQDEYGNVEFYLD